MISIQIIIIPEGGLKGPTRPIYYILAKLNQ